MHVSTAALLSFVLCLLTNSATAQLIDSGEASYRPLVDERRFGVDEDRITTPADRRLQLPGEKPQGTIEFHLTRSWADTAAMDLAYCVCWIGGRKVPAVEDQPAPEPTSAAALVDPYAEPAEDATASDEAAAGSEAGGADPLGREFWPRWAIYIGNNFLFLQTGHRVLRCELSKSVRMRLAEQERVYFVVSFLSDRVLVYADGRFCAQFKKVELASMDGVDPLPDAGLDQVVIGARPGCAPGRRSLFTDINGELRLEASVYDLGAWLRAFDGKIGGIRIWSRAFAEDYVTDPDGRPRLALRGTTDVARSIAFPETDGGDEPSYADLICFSDFRSADRARHRCRPQSSVSGNWVNVGLTPRVSRSIPEGAGDNYGNVEDVPVITVVATGSPTEWIVYEDAELVGFLQLDPDGKRGVFSEDWESKGRIIPVEVGRDEMTFICPEKDLLFGGVDRRPAEKISLHRPNLSWVGNPVSKDNPFWTSQQIAFVNVPFRAFDITKMDPLHAYQGRTGSPRMVFAEPEPTEYRWDSIGKVVIPFAYFFCSLNEGGGGHDALLASCERDYAMAYAGHVGVSVDTPNFGFNADVRGRYNQTTGTSKTDSVAVTKSIAKDYALVLNRSQLRLHPDFVKAVDALAERARTGEGEAACAEFIESWGTHFAMGTTFGGMLVQERRFTQKDIQRILEKEIGVEAEVLGGVRSGPQEEIYGKYEFGLKVGFQQNESERAKDGTNKEKSTFWLIPGGKFLPAPDGPVSATITDPVPLFFDLRPLYDLFTPANFDDPFVYHDLRTLLRTRVRAYVAKNGDLLKAGPLDLGQKDLGKAKYDFAAVAVRVPRCFAGSLQVVKPDSTDALHKNEEKIIEFEVSTDPNDVVYREGDMEIDSDDWSSLEIEYSTTVVDDGKGVNLTLTWTARELESDQTFNGGNTLIRSQKQMRIWSAAPEGPFAARVVSDASAHRIYKVQGRRHGERGYESVGALAAPRITFDEKGRTDDKFQSFKAKGSLWIELRRKGIPPPFEPIRRIRLDIATDKSNVVREGKDDEIDTDDWTSIEVAYDTTIAERGRAVDFTLTWTAKELQKDKSYKSGNTLFRSTKTQRIWTASDFEPSALRIHGKKSDSTTYMVPGECLGEHQYNSVGVLASPWICIDAKGREDHLVQHFRSSGEVMIEIAKPENYEEPPKPPRAVVRDTTQSTSTSLDWVELRPRLVDTQTRPTVSDDDVLYFVELNGNLRVGTLGPFSSTEKPISVRVPVTVGDFRKAGADASIEKTQPVNVTIPGDRYTLTRIIQSEVTIRLQLGYQQQVKKYEMPPITADQIAKYIEVVNGQSKTRKMRPLPDKAKAETGR